jgi:hypothetical protein
MTTFLQSCLCRCQRVAGRWFYACFAADSNDQLWRWMLPRETEQLRVWQGESLGESRTALRRTHTAETRVSPDCPPSFSSIE